MFVEMQHTLEEEESHDDGSDTCRDYVHEHHTQDRDHGARLNDSHNHDQTDDHDHENQQQSVPDLLLELIVTVEWSELATARRVWLGLFVIESSDPTRCS